MGLRIAPAAGFLLTLSVLRCAAVGAPEPAAPPSDSPLGLLAVAQPGNPRQGWRGEEVAALARRLLRQPERFVEDPSFRASIWNQLARVPPKGVSPELLHKLANELNQVRGVDFAMSEALEDAWGLIPRRSLARREELEASPLTLASDAAGPITCSFYSLFSWFFSADESRELLSAVRRLGADREIVALVDSDLAEALEPTVRSFRVNLLDSLGRGYSPWPRDPFSLARRRDGGVTFLVRPNRQVEREEDAFLAQELIQNLPPRLDRTLGEPRWTVSPRPFHNGQMLLTERDLWLSVHSLEVRVLELLKLDRVPVESFNQSAGIARYVAASQQAARELGEIFRRQARFVHPLPDGSDLTADQTLMQTLAGGAGFDLDSLLTLLEPPGGARVALIGDLTLGQALVERLSANEATVLIERYGLRGPARSVLAELVAASGTQRSLALGGFLDQLALSLGEQGWQIRRLPLLRVPLSLREDSEGIALPDFLLTWNNVVLESRGGRLRAEGFASLLPTADADVVRTFREVGVDLTLLPPLVRSVILSGGYRCASNHLRGP